MNQAEKTFSNKAIQRGGILLFNKSDSILFVELCRELNIELLGIDGFILTQYSTQPSIENSIDFTSHFGSIYEDIFAEAVLFLQNQDDDLFFEIVCKN